MHFVTCFVKIVKCFVLRFRARSSPESLFVAACLGQHIGDIGRPAMKRYPDTTLTPCWHNWLQILSGCCFYCSLAVQFSMLFEDAQSISYISSHVDITFRVSGRWKIRKPDVGAYVLALLELCDVLSWRKSRSGRNMSQHVATSGSFGSNGPRPSHWKVQRLASSRRGEATEIRRARYWKWNNDAKRYPQRNAWETLSFDFSAWRDVLLFVFSVLPSVCTCAILCVCECFPFAKRDISMLLICLPAGSHVVTLYMTHIWPILSEPGSFRSNIRRRCAFTFLSEKAGPQRCWWKFDKMCTHFATFFAPIWLGTWLHFAGTQDTQTQAKQLGSGISLDQLEDLDVFGPWPASFHGFSSMIQITLIQLMSLWMDVASDSVSELATPNSNQTKSAVRWNLAVHVPWCPMVSHPPGWTNQVIGEQRLWRKQLWQNLDRWALETSWDHEGFVFSLLITSSCEPAVADFKEELWIRIITQWKRHSMLFLRAENEQTPSIVNIEYQAQVKKVKARRCSCSKRTQCIKCIQHIGPFNLIDQKPQRFTLIQ